MKKFLAIFLALVLCFTAALALVSCGKEETTGATLDDAVEYLKSAYKSDEGKKTTNDYAMPAQVVVEGVTFTITYVVDNAAIKVVYNETKKLYDVDLPDVNTEETPYKLTATIANAAGETKTLEFGRILPVIQKVSGVVTAPVAETPYKLFFDQKNLAQVLFIIAEADGTQFLKTNKDPKVAPDWYVEVEGDGYKIYTVVNNVKMYMYATAAPRAGEEGKFDKAITLSADNGSVFKYKEDINAWYTSINTTPTAEVANNIDFAIGTYGTFKTLCISETSYYTPENTGVEQFPMSFITKAEGEAMTPSEEIADPTTVTSIADVLAIATAKEHDKYTVEKYLIEGVITEIKSTKYGNMYVSDGNGNTIYVYGLYDDSGETSEAHRYDSFAKKPQVGDTVKLMGIVGQYNGTAQMKNAQLKGHTEKQWSDAEKVAAVKAALTVAAVNSNKVVDLPLTDATHASVTITWALASSYTGSAATLDATTGKLTVTLQDAAETVTLVATIKSGEVTDTKEVTVAVAEKPTYVLQQVATPVVDTWYYFYVVQETLGETYYFNGANDGYYVGTTADMTAAVKVKLVLRAGTTDEYDLVFDDNGTTKYLVTYVSSNGYVNGKVDAAPGAVGYKYNTYIGGLEITLNVSGTNTVYYLGTFSYNGTDNTNIRASKISFVLDENNQLKAGTNYVCHFGELVDVNSISDADKVAQEKAALDVETVIDEAGTVTLPAVGATYGNVTITWAVGTNNCVTLNGNVLTVVIPTADATVTLTATIAIGTTTETKEFTLTVKAPVEEPDTIAEILAAKNTTTVFWAEGVVVATNSRSFLLKDATGYILVYENKAPTVAVGDKVDVKGKTSEHKGTWQFTNTGLDVTEIGTESSFTQPTPTVMDGAAFGAVAAPVAPAYVKVTGVLVKSGNYFNLNVDGSATPGSLTYLTGDLATAANALAGKLVEVVGYTTGNIGNFINLMVTSVAEATTTDAQKAEIEKAALSITTSFSGNGTLTLPATGKAYTGVAITWTVNGTAVTGTYAITQTAEAQTLTVVATLTCGTAAPVTKEFTVTVAAAPAAGSTTVKKTAAEINTIKPVAAGSTTNLDANASVTFNKGQVSSTPKLHSDGYILIYQNNSGKTAGNGITFKVGTGYKLDKIVLTKYSGGQNASGATTLTVVGGTATVDANGNIIITPNEGVSEVTITCMGTNNKQDRLWLSAIEIIYSPKEAE